ncbi:NnrU family protein [Roseiarcus sp.]|uniref:NnrU family protein n=1 Tax=Roseiarcus sp. TaxID=1969460 RepID=UPI003F98F00E
MTLLVFGLVIFLGLHSIRIFAESGRERAIARLGEGPWKGVYALLSLIGLVMIIWGFGEARWTAPILWAPPFWTSHIAVLLMLISMILLAAYLLKTSHIAVAVHHPMLWAVVIWAVAHLLANGSAADLVLFGAFLVWSLLDLSANYARDRAKAIAYPAPNWGATIGAVVIGIVVWGLLIGGLHLWLFGVAPLAM